MVFDFECIIKTAKDSRGNILWRALYVNNIKEFENYDLDLSKIVDNYSPLGKWKEIIIIEDNIYSLLEEYFPEKDDFIDLMDYSDIFINKEVYLSDGKYVVSEFWKDYRPSDVYEIWHWENIDNKYYAAKTSQYLLGHDIIKFKVLNSDSIYIWEDWNYQQSFLYLNSIQHD
jgi:hypothetical protein